MSVGGHSHTAAGSVAGIVFQFDRVLHRLAESPYGAIVGIETEDDVAVRLMSGGLLLEQNKHSLQASGHPYADRSVDLWKTLCIWADALRVGQADAERTTFFLVTNRPVPPDCLARRIDQASSDADVSRCTADLRLIAGNPSDTLKPFCVRLLAHDEALLRVLVARVHCIDSAPSSSLAETRLQLAGLLQIPPHVDADQVINGLAGWLQRTAMAQWYSRRPAWIGKNAFAMQYNAIMEHMRRERQRERRAALLPVTSDQIEKQRGRPFVQQMELVTDSDSDITRAVRHFIQCSIERIRLSREGEIPDPEWEAFDDRLMDRWEAIRDAVARMPGGDPPSDLGYRIYERTVNHLEELAGQRTTERYLTAGTYHRLADRLQVGWHPNFKELVVEAE